MSRILKAKDKKEIYEAIKNIREHLDFLELQMLEADTRFLRDRSSRIFNEMDVLDCWIERFEEWED